MEITISSFHTQTVFDNPECQLPNFFLIKKIFMQKNKIYTLAVIDSRKVPIGIIRMHDLIEAGII